MNGKLIIFSAPSGSGKTTIVRELLKHYPQFEFSISATSRAPRGVEQNGVDYYFLTQEEFAAKVASDSFVEWEEVYAGTCYGTLKSEMERIWSKGNVIIFDVDVMGGISLKRIFGEKACSIFIMPPSIFTAKPNHPATRTARAIGITTGTTPKTVSPPSFGNCKFDKKLKSAAKYRAL